MHNYRNTTTSLNVTLDFVTNTLSVNVNNNPCIEFSLSSSVFAMPKATVSLLGYCTKDNPITMTLNELSIYKQDYIKQLEEPFHANINTLLSSIQLFDPYHFQNQSISNILLINVSSKGSTAKGDQQT